MCIGIPFGLGNLQHIRYGNLTTLIGIVPAEMPDVELGIQVHIILRNMMHNIIPDFIRFEGPVKIGLPTKYYYGMLINCNLGKVSGGRNTYINYK